MHLHHAHKAESELNGEAGRLGVVLAKAEAGD